MVELQDPHRKRFSIAIVIGILSLTHYERNVSLWGSHSELILEFSTDFVFLICICILGLSLSFCLD